jgi:hypothetical protein
MEDALNYQRAKYLEGTKTIDDIGNSVARRRRGLNSPLPTVSVKPLPPGGEGF